MRENRVSNAVIRRLPKYYRYLDELSQKGEEKISSKRLAEVMGLTASQIRQDFNCFGGFGQQGYGYPVDSLMREIAEILGVHNRRNAIIIGVGNIGRALIHNFNFERCGFTLCAAFDTDERIIGTEIDGIAIYPPDKLESVVKENKVEIAALTLPRAAASKTAEQLHSLGVRGLWNFTNIDLHMRHSDIKIENVHFDDSLMTLAYWLNQ